MIRRSHGSTILNGRRNTCERVYDNEETKKKVNIAHHKHLTDYIFIKSSADSVSDFFLTSFRKQIRILSERNIFFIIESLFK